MPLKDDVLARDPVLTVLSVVAVTIFTAIFMLCCLLEEGLTFIVYCMEKFCNNFLFTWLRPLCTHSIFYCIVVCLGNGK